MRTVDPGLWSKKARGRRMNLTRPLRFGQIGLGARLRSCSYDDAMAEFWNHCSVAAYRHWASKETGKWERYYWSVILVIFSCCAMVAVTLTAVQILEDMHPSVDLSKQPVNQVHFPAIAICSFNIISKQALDIATKEIVKLDAFRSHTLADLRENILNFARLQMVALHTPALPVLERQITPVLRAITSRYGFPIANITEFMYLLAPTCESRLVKCSWRGKEMPCDFLFAARLTSVGYCCVFNSRYEQYDLKNPPRILDRVGSDNGLSVIYQEVAHDFALARRPVYGTEVLIFDGSEYPLLEGGAVRVQRTHLNASVYFKLDTRAQLASPSLDIYPESLRECRMKGALSEDLPSYSSCLLECRRSAILDLCGCVPYSLQPRDELVCSLDHLLCLTRHREKFLYYFPSGFSQLVLREESANALVCPECRPNCARTLHSVTSSWVGFHRQDKTFHDPFMSGVKNLVDASALHFFYPKVQQDLYTIEPNKVWFECIATLSSQWVGVFGVTLLTFFELVFHCTVRRRHHYVRRKTTYTNLRGVTPSDIC